MDGTSEGRKLVEAAKEDYRSIQATVERVAHHFKNLESTRKVAPSTKEFVIECLQGDISLAIMGMQLGEKCLEVDPSSKEWLVPVVKKKIETASPAYRERFRTWLKRIEEL